VAVTFEPTATLVVTDERDEVVAKGAPGELLAFDADPGLRYTLEILDAGPVEPGVEYPIQVDVYPSSPFE
jgi:hypothetical protein